MPVALSAFLFALLVLISGCTGIPDNVSPVSGFDVNRYLGKWYEIARLDHSFERGLEQVTAEYSLRDDGGIRVLNRGYDRTNQRWKRAEGAESPFQPQIPDYEENYYPLRSAGSHSVAVIRF